MIKLVFNKPKRVYVAYANHEGMNELLIRDGNHYYVLTSHKEVIPISAFEAYRTLKLIKEQVLPFRGIGSYKHNIKNEMKGAI